MEKEIKKLFNELYKGFPNGRLSEGIVHKIIVTEEDRAFLVKCGYLAQEEVMSDGKMKKYYNLGPNALPLISSWKVEKLTYWLVVITIVLAVLTVISIVKLA
jgi:cytochrome b subunit of formate dehydrogenase